MAKPVIKAEQVSKKFIISHDAPERYLSIRDIMARKVKSLVGKGQTSATPAREDFFALRDINFEVNPGDRLGIIGRNGAGKSTLLKILSRITSPTSGRITIRGRVASLLEVGTGFHPELTGRENIFLNGAILGMARAEIRRKFDEIVAFAEVEKFLDTPVKRYSSGMYVRLAFAVAAHLEPEILIVDEVLAVGDAEFQKKCLGKMKDVSEGGRTVLFVSHNMTAIKNLCQKGILLGKGVIEKYGTANDVVDGYLQSVGIDRCKSWQIENAPGGTLAKLLEIAISTQGEVMYIDDPLNIHFKVALLNNVDGLVNFSLVISNQEGVPVFNVGSHAKRVNGEIVEAVCHIPANLLNDEFYTIRILLVLDSSIILFDLNEIMAFKMEEREREGNWHGKWIGMVRPQELIKWTY